MFTFFTLKRLSPLGAALLILIMVVMLYPVLPPKPEEVHAAASCTQYVSNSSELQNAMTSATAGAVVCLRAGTYTGSFSPRNSGTSGNLIVFQADPAAPAGSVIMHNGKTSGSQARNPGTIEMGRVSYIQIGPGLTFSDDFYPPQIRMCIPGTCDWSWMEGNVITGNTFKNLNSVGYDLNTLGGNDSVLTFGWQKNFTVSNNTFDSTGIIYNVINVGNLSNNGVVTGNTIIQTDNSPSWGTGGIELACCDSPSQFTDPMNVTISNNTLISKTTTNRGIALWCDVFGNHYTFTRNIVQGNWGLGAKDEAGCHDNTFSYNVFSGTDQGLCNCSGETSLPGQYGEIVIGNVFYKNKDQGYRTANTTKATLKNNIFYLNGSVTSGRQLMIGQKLVDGSGNNFNYNDYCTSSGCTASNNIAYIISNDLTYNWDAPNLNLSQWGARIGGEGNSIAANPLFVNADAGDFHLQSNSPAKCRGESGVDMGLYPNECSATPTPTPTPTPQSNPVSWYKLDESSGTTATDSSGNNNTGTLVNGPVWTSGKLNGALQFDGTNDYVRAANSPSLAISGAITMSTWVNASTFPSLGNLSYLVGKGYDGIEPYFLRWSNPSGTPSLEAGSYSDSGGGNGVIWPVSGINPGEWHHVAGTYDGTRWTMYVDGQQKAATAASSGALANTQDVYLGGTNIGGTLERFFTGKLDDVRIYNRALSPSEIQTLAAAATPTPTPTPGPVACSQYTPSTSIPTGYASPYDVVSSPNTNLMNVTCLNLTDARLDLGRGDPLQYIYNQGYLFKTGGTQWIPISYTSTESLIAGAWYPKTATAIISLTSTELTNPSYNLAYICSWVGSAWKCGCRDSACTQSYWMIQSFKR